MSADLTTEAGAREWIEHLKAHARRRFLEFGDLSPQAFFLATRDPDTGAALDPPGLHCHFIESDLINQHGPRKDVLAMFLRAQARRCAAIGYLWMSEAWVLQGESPSWEHVPGRREVLSIFVEHRALPKRESWGALVTRPKKGPPQLGEWSKRGEPTGRFSQALPVETP